MEREALERLEMRLARPEGGIGHADGLGHRASGTAAAASDTSRCEASSAASAARHRASVVSPVGGQSPSAGSAGSCPDSLDATSCVHAVM